MERQRGTVYMGGSLAYAAQQAWIMNDTLINNVLFGGELNEARWQACLEVCIIHCWCSWTLHLPSGCMCPRSAVGSVLRP